MSHDGCGLAFTLSGNKDRAIIYNRQEVEGIILHDGIDFLNRSGTGNRKK